MIKAVNHTMDSRTFTVIYTKYRRVIQAYISYRIPRPFESEDLTHDVFMRLLESGCAIDGTSVCSYLYTIARNIIIDTLRRHYKKTEVMAEWEKNQPAATQSSEYGIYAVELATLYGRQIKRLSDQRRKVYELVDCEDMSIGEVATRLNLSLRTVGNHLYAARKEIRNNLSLILNAA